MPHYIYILHSKSSDKYYIGQTENVLERVSRQNRGHSKSTKSGVPWDLVYTEEFPNRSQAYQREQYIKSMKSRHFLEKLIAQPGERPD